MTCVGTARCWPPAPGCSGLCPSCSGCSITARAARGSAPPRCARSSARTSAKSSGSSRRSMRSMRSLLALLAAVVITLAHGAEPPVPVPQGYVTDLAHVIGPDVRARIERVNQELRDKTGAEIAVVTVETTAPLDDFTYAMRIADAWKPGRKREDTGVVFLVATRDRKLRVLVGYGLEGILPDGLVGEIEDREVVPAFRAGRVDDGVWQGVAALAERIAAARGVTLGNAPAARPEAPPPVTLPSWVFVLVVILIIAG